MDQDRVNAANRLLEEYHANLEKGIEPTKRQVEILKNQSTSKIEKLAKDLGSKQFANLERGVKDYTKAMYEGKQGMEAMVGSLEAVAAVATIVTTVIPQLRLLTIAFSALTSFVIPAVKKISQQADELFKTYQDLNKNGMATAGGMTDVYNNMQRLNYGLKDLAKMTALLRDNSTALANFGGTAAQGARVFTEAANEIQHTSVGRTFQQMGKTPDEINRGIAGFIKSQQSLGIQNVDINKNLASRSAEYVMQLDLVSRLTGLSQDQIQEKLDQAAAEEAFNQTQYELKKRADAGDAAAYSQYIENQKVATVLTGTALKEFQQGIGGNISAMSKTMMTAHGAVALVQRGSFTAAEYLNELGKGSQEARDRFGYSMKMNATNDFLLPAQERSALESRYADQSAQRQEDRAKAEQKNQKEALEPNTKAAVDLRINQQNTRDSLQNLVNKGIEPATTALEFLERAGGAALRYIPGTKSEVVGGDLGAKGGVARTTDELRKMGLLIRSGDVQADGRLLDERLIKLAKLAQGQIKGFGVITSLNDRFHAERYSTSQHALGRAMDFTLDHRPSEEEGQQIVRQLKGMGASYVIDEYNHPSAGATGGHIHAQVSAALGFEGILSGSGSGYKPNIIMHGKERLTIIPKKQTSITVSKLDSNTKPDDAEPTEDQPTIKTQDRAIIPRLPTAEFDSNYMPDNGGPTENQPTIKTQDQKIIPDSDRRLNTVDFNKAQSTITPQNNAIMPSNGYKVNIVEFSEERPLMAPKNQATVASSPFDADTASLMKTRLEKINLVVELFQEKQKKNQIIPLQKIEQFTAMINTMQNQVDLSTKILQQSR